MIQPFKRRGVGKVPNTELWEAELMIAARGLRLFLPAGRLHRIDVGVTLYMLPFDDGLPLPSGGLALHLVSKPPPGTVVSIDVGPEAGRLGMAPAASPFVVVDPERFKSPATRMRGEAHRRARVVVVR